MKKPKKVFLCRECGYESPKWLGQCPGCHQWTTMEEFRESGAAKSRMKDISGERRNPQPIEQIPVGRERRFQTGIGEFDRVLGGGMAQGSLVLISGEPGVGKSTLILQAGSEIARRSGTVLYVTGEESEEQIHFRAARTGAMAQNLLVVSETDVVNILDDIQRLNPVFVIIDSVQTLFHPELTSAPGTVSQIKECVNGLMRKAKQSNVSMMLVAHVTKQGDLAGPRVIEHIVDTVLHFEGERTQEYRILRSVKNRFGTTSEIGVFEMRQEGLTEVGNPSALFLESLNREEEGAMVAAVVEGTRPILVELQALVTPCNAGFPRRTTVGVDGNRVGLMIAVLEKKIGIPLMQQDVYLNVIGGLRLEGTAADLAMALAMYSSFRGKALPVKSTVAIGEISLTGEVRPVGQIEKMIREAQKLGFTRCLIPQRNLAKLPIIDQMEMIGVSTLKEAIEKTFNLNG
jgi:DNA repair protein RadA/Sms